MMERPTSRQVFGGDENIDPAWDGASQDEGMVRHRLRLEDRGAKHVHRWRARCLCGWSSIPFNLKRSAAREGRLHGRTPAQRQGSLPERRPVTPAHRLPPWPQPTAVQASS